MKKIGATMLVILICMLGLAACQAGETSSSPSTKVQVEQKEIKANILPTDGFIENVGWLSNSEILSVKNGEGATAFYNYNVYDGSKEKIYEIPSSYVSASISPDREKILIQSSPISYSAQVTIIDQSGSVLFQESVPSYELTYSWNNFNEETLLLTSFSEDWSFQVFQINIEENTMDPIEVDQPFVQWQSESSVLFQEWDAAEVSISAPLIAQNILNDKKEMVVDASIHFNQFNDTLLSIFSREEEGTFTYQFITSNGEIQSEFTVELLSRYSDWLVPYYDMIEGENQLITFVANEPGSFDTYSGTFSLQKWDTASGKEFLLLEDIPLEPIQCSQNGESCLYGNQLEKVINLKKSTIRHLLKEEGADM